MCRDKKNNVAAAENTSAARMDRFEVNGIFKPISKL
jgi:hypothetical protein